MPFRPARAVLLSIAGAVALVGCTAAQPTTVQPRSHHLSLNPTRSPWPTSTEPHLPPVVSHGPRTGNAVALTFDADLTPEMLLRLRSGQVQSYANRRVIDLLEERGVPATFFLTGLWAREYPDVVTRLATNPAFELANHSWSHGAFTPSCYGLSPIPRAEMAAELQRTFDIIAPFGGNQTRFFRFPGLCYNAAALTAIAPLGVTVVGGDVVSGDPLARTWPPIVRAVLDHVQPGSIVIMHITEQNATMTDEALPSILDGLAARNLRPVRLSELLA